MLTKSFMRIVIDLLARAPIADPARSLNLRVDNVAADLDVSTKTVTRALNHLRKLGWLSRKPGTDGRNNRGEFACGEFVLGEELRAMLGLPTLQPKAVADSREPEPEPVENTPKETEMSPGVYTVNKVFLKEASFQKEASHKTSRKTPKIPADLTALNTELGIDLYGICALMRLANTVKQRLQDVWIARRDSIRSAGATGGRAYDYFEFLLNTGEDFALPGAAEKRLRQGNHCLRHRASRWPPTSMYGSCGTRNITE